MHLESFRLRHPFRATLLAALPLIGLACGSDAGTEPAVDAPKAPAPAAKAPPETAMAPMEVAKPTGAPQAAPAAASASHARAVEVVAPGLDAAQPAELPGLHNVVAYASGVYSGSVPHGAEGFESLREMGIKTIVSVDGAAPDVAAAKSEGLRYVHLPIGYDGVPEERGKELARALNDLEGPFYLHCHHGKHRSAAAAGVACVSLGKATHEQAVARMKVSGTAPDYVGLYQSVEESQPVTPAELAAASNAFPEVAVVEGMVALMSEIDEVFDLIKQVKDSGWAVPADHPDLVPAKETARLRTLFGRVRVDPDAQAMPADFQAFLNAAEEAAVRLDDSMQASAPSEELAVHLETVQDGCKRCHVVYRDKPR